MRLKLKVVWVHLEIVLILAQDRCTVCAKHTIGLEIILDAPDGTPRGRGSCGILFGPFVDGVSVSARSLHGLRQTYHRLRYHLGRTRWYSKVTKLKW